MGDGDEPMNNWTAWCTQNVLLAACTRPLDPDRRREVVTRAAASLDAFVKDYGPDGACAEGAMYWRHAGLCLWGALHILSDLAPAAFAPIWQDPLVRNIAEFVQNVHVAGPWSFNFGDCSAVNERCGAREFLFGQAVGSAPLADLAASDAAEDPAPDLPQEINLWYRALAAHTAAKMASHGVRQQPRPDIWYPSIGLMIARDDSFALAVKAGNNGDSHNHNDIGSLILYRYGRPMLVDIGVETYSAQTFSPRRYEIWTMQSAWHNILTFGGVMQAPGPQFAARDVQVDLTATEARIEMELSAAWPEAALLRSYRRKVLFTKGKTVEIEDVYDGDLPAELTLMLQDRPQVGPGSITLQGLGRIELSGAGTIRVEAVPITDPRLRQSWPDQLWRVLVPLTGARLHLTIR